MGKPRQTHTHAKPSRKRRPQCTTALKLPTRRERRLPGLDVEADDLLYLIHGLDDRHADLLPLVRRESREQAVGLGSAAAYADRQVVSTRIVQEALSRDFHQESILEGLRA